MGPGRQGWRRGRDRDRGQGRGVGGWGSAESSHLRGLCPAGRPFRPASRRIQDGGGIIHTLFASKTLWLTGALGRILRQRSASLSPQEITPRAAGQNRNRQEMVPLSCIARPSRFRQARGGRVVLGAHLSKDINSNALLDRRISTRRILSIEGHPLDRRSSSR